MSPENDSRSVLGRGLVNLKIDQTSHVRAVKKMSFGFCDRGPFGRPRYQPKALTNKYMTKWSY